MALSQNTGGILRKGSTKFAVLDSTAAAAISGTVAEFPIVASSGIAGTPATETATDEGGNTYEEVTSFTTRFTAEILQKDVATAEYFQTNDGYKAFLKQMKTVKAGDTEVEFMLIPKVKLDGSFNFSSSGNQSVDLLCEAVTADTGISIAQFETGNFAVSVTGTITVAAGQAVKFFTLAIA
jgi:hypothetical protein